MKFVLDINDRPFNAIKKGSKTIEGRTLTAFDKTPYNKLKKGDSIQFINNSTDETIIVNVKFVHHYPDVRSMLEKEGVDNVLSSKPKTIEYGIESYNSLEGYEDGIRKNGIYAIKIK